VSSDALFAALLLGLVGSVGIFAAVRRLCARRLHPGHAWPEPAAVQAKAAEDDAAAVAAVYRRVFVRRVWALLLCLAALAGWAADAGRAVCLLLAGAGCVMLYLAYRLRTEYVLRLARRKARLPEGCELSPEEARQPSERETIRMS